jgi:DNA-binding NtrC family response regulator
MKTLLVLEDDQSNMQVICAILWSEGYRVLEAVNGEEAIAAGNSPGSLDLLVADVNLPQGSGTDIALELMKVHPAMLVLFIPGRPKYAWDWHDLQNVEQLPPDHVEFLEKPFGITALLEKVTSLLHRVAY